MIDAAELSAAIGLEAAAQVAALELEADRLEAAQASHPCPSWSETVEARQMRRRAAQLRAGMI